MSANENPYASPVDVTAATNRQWIIRKLRPPAICLLVSGILLLIMFALNVLGIMMMGARQMDELVETQLGYWKSYGIVYAAMMLSSAAIIYAAIQMLRGRQYAACVIGAILALLPGLSPCFLLGIPFGIWALILLLRKDTRTAFGEAR